MKLKLALAAAIALMSRGANAQAAAAPPEPTATPAPATAPAEKTPAALSPIAAPSPQAVPVAPAPQAAAPAPQKVTYDWSGWFILHGFYDSGGLNAPDFARNATTAKDDSYGAREQTGVGVKQSRFRMNVGVPTDGFLAGASLKGLVEFDFAGAQASAADISTFQPRLRHAFVSSTWKQLNDLQVLVGQTWGVAPGPYFANSLTHIIMPRFGGAGFLFRRAPQVRVSGNVPLATGAALSVTAAALTPDTAEGNRSGMPHLEGRLGANYKMSGKQLFDVGVFTHYGTDSYETFEAATLTTVSSKYVGKDLNSQLVGVDAKIDVPYVSLVGTWFTGQNLHAYNATAPGVIKTLKTPTGGTATTAKGLVEVQNSKTTGFFAQATVTPIKGVQLIGGYGVETPDEDNFTKTGTDVFATATAPQIVSNAQISGGVILNVTSKWRVGLEYTQYSTEYFYGKAAADQKQTFDSSQIEFGTLLAF
jgi:hypothetical protein